MQRVVSKASVLRDPAEPELTPETRTVKPEPKVVVYLSRS